MDHIQRFPKAFERNDERNVGFGSPLRTSNHVNTLTSERTEQLPSNTGRMFHVLTDNGNRSQIGLLLDLVDLAHLDLTGKLFRKDFHREICVSITHTDRSRILRGCLRNEENANPRFSQCLKDSVIDADHADHTQPLNRNQTCIVD